MSLDIAEMWAEIVNGDVRLLSESLGGYGVEVRVRALGGIGPIMLETPQECFRYALKQWSWEV